MTEEPVVDGLVRDAEFGGVGQSGDDAGHADVGHTAAELGTPPRGQSRLAPLGQRVVSDHHLPFGSHAEAPAPGRGETHRLQRTKRGEALKWGHDI